MNAEPRQVLVALAISNRFPVEAVDELYEGMLLACKHYGVDLVGGDTCSNTSGLVISVTAIGAAKPGDIVYRDGAREHDLLVVTGDLGGAFMDCRCWSARSSCSRRPAHSPIWKGTTTSWNAS